MYGEKQICWTLLEEETSGVCFLTSCRQKTPSPTWTRIKSPTYTPEKKIIIFTFFKNVSPGKFPPRTFFTFLFRPLQIFFDFAQRLKVKKCKVNTPKSPKMGQSKKHVFIEKIYLRLLISSIKWYGSFSFVRGMWASAQYISSSICWVGIRIRGSPSLWQLATYNAHASLNSVEPLGKP